jgi:group I intron endonuclease
MGLIYKITSPTGRIYIGQTAQTSKGRQRQYRSLRKRDGKSLILRSIRKYGWDAHVFEVVEDNIPKELLNEKEIYWVAKFKTYVEDSLEGMNLTRGGDYRESWKNDKNRVERAKQRRGEKAPNWGKKLLEETKRKIAKSVSEYNKANGVKPSAECHKKAKEAQYVPVVAYDRNGDFIGEYPYIKAAADALGLDRKCVNDTVNGVQKHTKGYFFRRREEGYPMKIDISGVKLLLKKRAVLCYVGEDVVEYSNPNEAAAALGLWHQTIKDAANLGKPLRNGYRFVYKDSLN